MQACVFEPVLARLREAVYPSVEGYWRADAAITMFLDASLPRVSGEVTACWLAALGAFFHPDRVALATAGVGTPWMNRRTMEACLKNLGVTFQKQQGVMPPQGVALLQKIPQSEKRSYRGSFLVDTHWIAVIDDYVFDVNWPQWLPRKHWKSLVGAPVASWDGAQSWKVVTGYEILLPSSSRRENGIDRPAVGSQSVFPE